MKTNPAPASRVSADELLAYAEGSLAGAELERVQAALCASRPLFEEMQALRRRIYQRSVLPPPPDLLEEAAAIEAALAGPPAWQRAWKDLSQWCASLSAETVAAVELTGQAIRTLGNTAWIPVPTTTRLQATRAAATPGGGSDLCLEHGGNTLRMRPTDTGVELTVVLAVPLTGQVRIRRAAADPTPSLDRFPGTQTAWIHERSASLTVPCGPGLHPMVVEIADGNQVHHRWAVLIHRPA